MRPQVFWCLDDGGTQERWVLKLRGRFDSELAADWIGCLLAHRIGILCPEVDLANVTSEALATAPHEVQTWAQPGAAFGSRELTNTVAAQSDDDVLQFVNPDYLGMLFALDTWLEVLDRKKPDGIWNMLINTGMRQAEDRRAMVIDFGKGLTSCMVPIVGRIDPVVPDYPLGVRRFSSLEAATKTATAISEIHEDDIISIVRSVPTAWITDEAKERIVSELVERAPRVQSVCEQLHSTVPRWN